MINTPPEQPVYIAKPLHPALQFLIFAGVFIGALTIGNIIGVGIIAATYGLKTLTAIMSMDTTAANFAPSLWILQTTGTTLPILAAALFFAWVVVKDTKEYIRPTLKFSWVLLVLVAVIMFASTPTIEFLSNLNQKMVLPPFLKWMRDSEDNAEKLTAILLQMKTVWGMLANVIFVGLITAIVEEFMFRGVIQTIFLKWTNNMHAAIWITAILFSAFHMEFFGFLPRLLLGAMFGYFVAWSGSIWTGVLAHFINNATAVVLTYLYQQKQSTVSPDDNHVFNYAWYVISFVIILFLFWVYHNVALKKKPVQV